MSCRGFSKRVRSPSSATMVTATVNWTPRKAWRASTTGAKRQLCTCSWSSSSRRPRRSVCCDGLDVFLKDDLLRGGRTDHLAEPAEMGWAPVGSPGIADIVSQQEGFEPQLGRFQV